MENPKGTIIKAISRLALWLVLLVSLGGCATYFERAAQNSCFKTDWYAKGFNAAARGQDYQESWHRLDNDCKRHNVWSDQDEFERGYDLGRDAFCRSQNGFEFGLRNRDYYPICDAIAQSDFDYAYIDGHALYDQRRQLDEVISDLYRLEEFIDYAVHRRRELAHKLDYEDLDEPTRKKIVKERYRLKKKMQSAEYDVSSCQAEVREARARTSNLEQSLYRRYYPNGSDSNGLYSVNLSVITEKTVINEPAIIVYKPKKFALGQRASATNKINIITKHITVNYPRSFRFQVLGKAQLSLLMNNGTETRVSTHSTFDTEPQLMFWNPRAGLETQPLIDPDNRSEKSEEFVQQTLTRQLDSFITRHHDFNNGISQPAAFTNHDQAMK